MEFKNELINDQFHLVIYGSRRYHYEKMDNIITEKGLSPVLILHDEVGGDAMKFGLFNADVFFMTFGFEGHLMGLIEALAYGLPYLVTLGTDMADVIFEANVGWVCG